jgi:site-specific recombinase XerC
VPLCAGSCWPAGSRAELCSPSYRRTGNLRAVQLLLGHTKIESTVRYLGIEVDDAIEIAEKIDI